MVRDKPQTDNVFLLSNRQTLVAGKLTQAMFTEEGLSDEEWFEFIDGDLTHTITVPYSPRLEEALMDLSLNLGYHVASNLFAIYKMIRVDFARSRELYVLRGWTTLESDTPMVKSTMTDPIAAEKIMGPLLEEEDNE